MKLLLDQGLPRGAREILQRLGFDAAHTGDVGLARASDESILDWAESEERVVVTLDADFHRILALRSVPRPSVLRIRAQGLRAEEVAELVATSITSCSGDLDAGAAVTVDNTGAAPRVRRLPL